MSTPAHPSDLYPLLPAVYRIADAENGEPLRALIDVVEGPFRAVSHDLTALYDDWFVETCAPGLLPYVGDLVGVDDAADPNGVIATLRTRVANALAYARRKGPAWVLAHAAGDVTGWPARAVERFELLSQTQDVADVRASLGRTADLRFAAAVEAGTPFDRMARTAPVRGAATVGVWAADRVGLFLWRLRAYPQSAARPREVGPGRFTLCPFGVDTPLFVPPRTAPAFAAEPAPWDVPGPVSRELLVRALEEAAGPDDPWAAGEYPLLRVWAGAGPASAAACPVVPADLGGWRAVHDPVASSPTRPTPPRVAVDPARGRIAFLDGARPAWVRVDWSYGFGADLGGGPYARPPLDPAPGPDAFTAAVGGALPPERGVQADTVAQALSAWLSTAVPDAVVHLRDSAIHPSPSAVVALPRGRRLWIVAAPGQRPCLAGDLNLSGVGGAVMLDGVLVDGTVRLAGTLDLTLSHCTVAPPTPPAAGEARRSVVAQPGFDGSVAARRSVLGPLAVPPGAAVVSLADSIVAGAVYAVASGTGDADAGAAAPLSVERCTLLGMVRARSVAAVDSIFVDPVLVDDVAAGGLTCCFAPLSSRSPGRDRCQPDGADPSVRPLFTSLRYGDPAFAQLHARCAAAIRSGASDGAEMGAFHLLDNPRREANLRAAVAAFLPVGLEAEVSFVT